MNGAVFLDRDGTIIEDKDYLHRPEEVVIYPGVGAALKRLQDVGFKLFIVTNQSGVGRGKFPLEDVHRVNEHLCRELAKDGVRFEKIYIAPEAPDQPSRGRKPSPQFLFDARDEFGLNLAQSYMIGDKLIDLECGWKAGVRRSILVRTGYGAQIEQKGGLKNAFVTDDFAGAADWIATHSPIREPSVESREIAGWKITWEGNESYRHWALMEQSSSLAAPIVATVMLNPGSLRGKGDALENDGTLRILRPVFDGAARCLVLNLFDVATTQPSELSETLWEQRDKSDVELVHKLAFERFRPSGVIWAYGACGELTSQQHAEAHARVKSIRDVFKTTPTIWPLAGKPPSHPRRWQIEKQTDAVKAALLRQVRP